MLAVIVRVFRAMRRGERSETELERQLDNRGFFYGSFGPWMKVISKKWQRYPAGVIFGMGFDTATEVLLLTTAAYLASEHIPWQVILACRSCSPRVPGGGLPCRRAGNWPASW